MATKFEAIAAHRGVAFIGKLRDAFFARFFNARMLPEGGAHLQRIASGAETLMALSAAAF